jgi:hypothetical protein
MINTHTPSMNIHVQEMPFNFTFDKFSLCYNDPNKDHVKATRGLLLSEKYDKVIPGFKVTKTARYAASPRIPVPFGDCVSKHIVVLEADPHHPDVPSYRLEFNPSKITQAGFGDLLSFMDLVIHEDSLVFFVMGTVTRCDLALDFQSLHVRDVIVRTNRLQKHGVYADRHGWPETVYIGTPKSRRIVAYEKPDAIGSHLRLECRLKPKILGQHMAALTNPFKGVQLIPTDFAASSGLNIPPQFIADSMRIGGLKRALSALAPADRKVLRVAYANAQKLVPNLDPLWAKWPEALIGYGLGKHLGAVPVPLCTQTAEISKLISA